VYGNHQFLQVFSVPSFLLHASYFSNLFVYICQCWLIDVRKLYCSSTLDFCKKELAAETM
jgi:hypothetical protein